MVFETTYMSTTRTKSMEEQVDAIVEQVLLLLPPSHRQTNSLIEGMPSDTTLPHRHRMIQQFLPKLPLDLLVAIFARIYELPFPDSHWAVNFDQACEHDRDQVTRTSLKQLLVNLRDGRPNVIVQPHASLISTTLAERINHDLNQISTDMEITDTRPTKETPHQPMARSAPTQLTLATNRTTPPAGLPTTTAQTSTLISSSTTPLLVSSHPFSGASSVVSPLIPVTTNSPVPPVTPTATNRPRRTAVHTNPAAAIIKAQNAHLATPTTTAAPNTLPSTAATVQNQVTSPPSVNHTNPTTPAIGRDQQNNTAAHSRQRLVSELANNTVPTIF